MPVPETYASKVTKADFIAVAVAVNDAGEFRGARCHRATAQALTGGVNTAVSFSAATFDSHAYWSAGAPTRLTVPADGAGKYLIAGAIDFASSASSLRAIELRKNGTPIVSVVGQSVGSAHYGMEALDVASLAVGDYVDLLAYSNNSVDIDVAIFQPFLSLTFLGI